MSINLAFLADPHMCLYPRRRNFLSLASRKLWRELDTVKETVRGLKRRPTDLFIPASFDDRPLLAAADFISQIARDLDQLVLLGDLATTGMAQDLTVAFETFADASICRHLTSTLKPRFGGLNIPLHVVPGNHDRYQDDFATPGGRDFDQHFSTVYAPTNGVSATTITRDRLTVGLVSADFCFPDDPSIPIYRKYGRGRVEQSVLSELETTTRRWKESHPGKPVIWALHFSPDENVANSLQLEEKEEVIHQAQNLGVKHIFCGHTHLNRRTIGTHPHIYSAGSVSSIDDRHNHFLHICIVDAKGEEYRLEVHNFKYSEERDEFIIEPISTAA